MTAGGGGQVVVLGDIHFLLKTALVHICIAYEKLADLFFFVVVFFLSLRFFMLELGILANENLVSKIFKQPL